LFVPFQTSLLRKPNIQACENGNKQHPSLSSVLFIRRTLARLSSLRFLHKCCWSEHPTSPKVFLFPGDFAVSISIIPTYSISKITQSDAFRRVYHSFIELDFEIFRRKCRKFELSQKNFGIWTASVAYWSQFLATDPEVWVRFPTLPDFLKVVVLERDPFSLVITVEELLGRKSSGSSLGSRDYDHKGSDTLTTRHPSGRKRWHQLRRQAAVARSV
jgi:hypothetical protein